MDRELLRETESLCPVCLAKIPARRVREGTDIYLEKSCPEHGESRAVVWRDREGFAYERWTGNLPQPAPGSPGCPNDCGICPAHEQSTCCVLLEVTARCDQECPVCYAGGGVAVPDPDIETLLARLEVFSGPSKPFVYLTGGEPALRDDLPELIRRIKAMGFPHVQLNTNGRRLGRDKAYVQALAGAGLSFVFMQFDGVGDEANRALRGEDLFEGKRRAIQNCDEARLGVTLVPTVVPGVNLSGLGALVRFGVGMAPAVRGIHFQPVAYMGRCERAPADEQRATLPEVMAAICESGLVTPENLLPSACDHPLCGFHGDFMVDENGGLVPLSKPQPACCCGAAEPVDVEKNRNFVQRRWQRTGEEDPEEPQDIQTMDGFLSRLKSHGFTLTGMGFQDAYTLDIERLRRCSLHVVDEDGRVSPFCAHYLTDSEGGRLHGREPL